MKKLLLIIGTLLCVSTWQANAGTGYQFDSTITKDAAGNLIGKTIYGRDSLKKIIMSATYSWDSKLKIWIGVKKTEFIPNHLNASYNGWDTTKGTWIGEYRYVDYYDKNGKDTLRESDNGWNKITGTWIVYNKEEHHYDDSGLDTLNIYYIWNSATSNCIGKTKTVKHKYDNAVSDSMIMISYEWDKYSKAWIYGGKTKSYYDNNGKDTLDIITDASGVNKTKTVSKYDSDGNLTIKTSYTWNKNNSLWMLPSIKLGTKNEQIHDSKGNIILDASYTWNSITFAWEENNKSEYAYDDNGKGTQYTSYTWDKATSVWVGTNKYEHTYDDNGNCILYINYTWDTQTATWVNSKKEEYTYHTYDKYAVGPYQTLTYNWNTTSNTWIISSGTQSGNTYDSYGNALVYNSFSLDIATNKWIQNPFHTNIEKISYNNSGEITQKIYVSYNGTDSTKYKQDYTYDNNGKYTNYTYEWNPKTATWVGTYKYECTYDNNGKIIENAGYTWDTVSNVWIGQGNKYEYVFDKNGIKTQQTNSSWDSTKVAWKIDGITTFYHSAIAVTLSVSKNSVTIAAAQNSKASVIVNSDITWNVNFNGSTWLSTTGSSIGKGKDVELIFKAMANPTTSPRTATVTISGYEDNVPNLFSTMGEGISTAPITITVTQEAGDGTPVFEVNNEDISLYPNPAKTYFAVNTDDNAQVEVYTINGQLVLNKQITGKENIPISRLSAGLYIVKIKTANTVEIRNLIVE